VTPGDIDTTETVLIDLLKVGAVFYPPLAVALPIVTSFIQQQTANLKTGLANGTIVPDGQGGFVPITNSRYDPKTGEFL
jgi:hypothetical protein